MFPSIATVLMVIMHVLSSYAAYRLDRVMPAAMAAALATGKSMREPLSPPSLKTWEAPGTVALANIVVANAGSAEGAAAAATAAQVVLAASEGVHPSAPGEAASVQQVGQGVSLPGPTSSTHGDSALLEQQQQQGSWAAVGAGGAVSTKDAAGKLTRRSSGNLQSIDIPDGALGTVQGVLAPESLPPLNYEAPGSRDDLSPFATAGPESAGGSGASRGGAAAAAGVAARGGVGAVSSQGNVRQQQLRSGSFTVIREGRPMTDATVPSGLGSRQGSLTSPHSSSSNTSTYQQEGSFAVTPNRLSLSEAGGSEGVACSLPSNAALLGQTSSGGSQKLRTPFAILTEAPSRSQLTVMASSRPGNSSGGQEGPTAWPFGQVSGSGGSAVMSRRGSAMRSGSMELTLSQSQLATVASSDGSGSWHGAVEKLPMGGVRAMMLQTSKCTACRACLICALGLALAAGLLQPR